MPKQQGKDKRLKKRTGSLAEIILAALLLVQVGALGFLLGRGSRENTGQNSAASTASAELSAPEETTTDTTKATTETTTEETTTEAETTTEPTTTEPVIITTRPEDNPNRGVNVTNVQYQISIDPNGAKYLSYLSADVQFSDQSNSETIWASWDGNTNSNIKTYYNPNTPDAIGNLTAILNKYMAGYQNKNSPVSEADAINYVPGFGQYDSLPYIKNMQIQLINAINAKWPEIQKALGNG
ncbi:MAG: hypothetical protein IKQ39_03875 [Oscillospiraceae bacterium]|nr:hypothetical protein [Oscillospiraceae bacterium]